MTMPLLIGVLVPFAWLAGGYAWVRNIQPMKSRLEAGALGFPLGAAGFAALLFLLSVSGVRIVQATVLSLLVGWVVLPLLVSRAGLISRAEAKQDDRARVTTLSPIHLVLILAGIGLALTGVFLAIGRSYSTWDAIAIWSVKGYGIALEGSVFAAREWGAHGLAYPLNLPLQIAVFRILEGDQLPASKLIFLAYYLSLALGAFTFWRRYVARGLAPYLGAFFLASTPVVFEHATNGYANLPFATYVVLAALEAVQGIRNSDTRSLFASGLLFAAGAWTRPEGILVALSIYLALGMFRQASFAGWRARLVWWAPFVLTTAIWLIFAQAAGAGGPMEMAPRMAIAAIRSGEFHVDAFYWIARYLGREALAPTSWGLGIPVCLALVLLHATKLRSGAGLGARMTLIAGLAAGIASAVAYYGLSFLGDLGDWLGTGVTRMFLPAGILAMIGAITLVLEQDGGGAQPSTAPPHDGAGGGSPRTRLSASETPSGSNVAALAGAGGG